MFRTWRRKRIARRPVPAFWGLTLDSRVPFYRMLREDEKERLVRLTQILVAEKLFIGARGLVVSEEMKVVISAAAARLILALDVSYYDSLTEIVVYPGGFHNPRDMEDRIGEAHRWGVVVLSWEAVLAGLADPFDGSNTAFHEFAHVLDRANGEFNGTPQLHHPADFQIWSDVMSAEFQRMASLGPHDWHPLDPYALRNEAEFFAVATEVFFEAPERLAEGAPAVYREMRRFYRNEAI